MAAECGPPAAYLDTAAEVAYHAEGDTRIGTSVETNIDGQLVKHRMQPGVNEDRDLRDSTSTLWGGASALPKIAMVADVYALIKEGEAVDDDLMTRQPRLEASRGEKDDLEVSLRSARNSAR